jgi:hypothetical protein
MNANALSNLEKNKKAWITRSHLKNRIFAQGQGRTEFQPAGILKYVEDLKRGPNTDIGQKDFFEMASRFDTTLFTLIFLKYLP